MTTNPTRRTARLMALDSRTAGARKYLEANDVTRAIWELTWLIRTLEDSKDEPPEEIIK